MGIVLVTALGCGGSRAKDAPATVPVTGVVLLNGSPIGGLEVGFVPDGSGTFAFGATGDNGEFFLSTVTPGDGASTGKYKVTLNLSGTGSDSNSPEELKAVATRKSPINAKYSSVEKTDLKVEVVAEGKNHFELSVTP